MKEGSANATAGGARQRFRNALVVAEMALAVVLLVGAGLMLRTLWALQRIDLGLQSVGRADHAHFAAGSELPRAGAGRRLLFAPRGSSARDLPGVTAAGAARRCRSDRPSATSACGSTATCHRPAPARKGDWQIVTDGYLTAIGEQVLRGRGIDADPTRPTASSWR